jgi:hypothetical protein
VVAARATILMMIRKSSFMLISFACMPAAFQALSRIIAQFTDIFAPFPALCRSYPKL